MSAYKTSERMKTALIEAAGELFSERGSDAVTLKDIAEKAGTRPNSVTYHFGGKEALVDAVWSFVLDKWDFDRIHTYCRENTALLATDDGKRQLVSDVINLLFEMLYAEDQAVWINVFLIRSMLSCQWKERVKHSIFEPLAELLMRLFTDITGNDDIDSARCWALGIMSGGAIFTANLTGFRDLRLNRSENYRFYRRLQYTSTKNALFGAGLLK